MGSLWSRGISTERKEAVYAVLRPESPSGVQVPGELNSLRLPNVTPRQTGWTLAHVLVWRGDVEGLRVACQEGSAPFDDPDGTVYTEIGNTPLHLAASLGDIVSIKLLVGLGADTASVNFSGKQPLELIPESMAEAAQEVIKILDESKSQQDLSATALLARPAADRTLSSPIGAKNKARVQPDPLAEKYEF